MQNIWTSGGVIMRVYENGKYRDMTIEEIAELEAQTKQFAENLAPTVEEQIAELREGIEKLKELFTPLLNMIGGNK